DILLTELLDLLTDPQRALVEQLAVCRAPMSPDDLAYLLGLPEEPAVAGPGWSPVWGGGPTRPRSPPVPASRRTPRPPSPPPAPPDLPPRRTPADPAGPHQRALAMRRRRFEQDRGEYPDLLELARHQATLGQYDDLAAVARQAAPMLPGSLAAAAYLSEVRAL